MMENLQSLKVVSIGGLNSNVNHIQLSDQEPGSAVELLNFEASLYGGYRRLSGFQPLIEGAEFVDAVGAEGRILVTAVYGNDIIVARKQKSGNTYDFYKKSGSTWAKMTTGLTRSSVGVTRLRFRTFNFNGLNKIAFVDGVNKACVFDGTTWTEISSANTGATYAAAGGNQAINNPSYIEIFKNHLFLAAGNLVVHSAPLVEYDFTAASGAGQIPAGFLVNQIKTFRDSLIVFGQRNIKKIQIDSTNFVLNEITSDIGCLASDSILEISGSLIFLSQDGFRPISATDRIGDTQLETLSKKIQQVIKDEITTNNMVEVTSVLIRGKSQVRFFFSDPTKNTVDTYGIIGSLRATPDGGVQWEWSRSLGISASCTTSAYIDADEYILHGSYQGGVYRQEQGNSFNGSPVAAIYSTPFLDLGDAGIRKTMRKIRLFLRPEGNMMINAKLVYDWNDESHLNPNPYAIGSSIGNDSVYGTAIYGSSIYKTPITPVLISNVQGSGNSIQITYTTVDTNAPYTIQGALYEFSVDGRK